MPEKVTVVLAPEGQVGAWLREELAVLIRAQLAVNAWWYEAGGSETPQVASIVGAGGSVEGQERDELFRVLAQSRAESLQVVRVVTAGAPVPSVDPHALGNRLRQVWADRELAQLNVVVPTEDHGELATVSTADLVGGWTNLVISPEDSVSAASASRPIEADGRYLAHVATAVVTVSGLWASMPGSPFSQTGPTQIQGTDQPAALVCRVRSRSLLLGATVDRVAGRVLHTYPPDRPTYAQFQTCEDYGDPGQLFEKVTNEIMQVDQGVLRCQVAEPAGPPLKQYLGFSGLVRLIFDFLRRRLPRIVVTQAQEGVARAAAGVEEAIERRILGGESGFVLRLFDADGVGEEVRPEHEMGSTLRAYAGELHDWPYRPPELAWEHLQTVCCGLADGGPTGDPTVRQVLQTGDTVKIVNDREKIVGPRDAPAWAPEEHVASLIGWSAGQWRRNDARYIGEVEQRLRLLLDEPARRPDGLDASEVEEHLAALEDATARHRRALLWHTAERLSREIDSAVALFRRIEELIGAASEEAEGRQLRRGFKRALLYMIVLVVGGAIALLLPFAGPIYLGIVGLLGLGWTLAAVGAVLGWVRKRWFQRIKRRQGEELKQWAMDNRYAVLVEINRLNCNYAQFLDWCDILFPVFDEPFGPAAVSAGSADLAAARRLLSHQVANADLTAEGFRGASARAARHVYPTGWLGRCLQDLRDNAMASFERNIGLPSEELVPPERDRTVTSSLGPIKAESSRLYFREHVRRPLERFSLRTSRWSELRGVLATEEITDLLDRVEAREGPAPGGSTPLEFLADGVRASASGQLLPSIWVDGVPPDAAELHAALYIGDRVYGELTKGANGLGDGVEVTRVGVDPEVLAFQAIIAEFLGPVDAECLDVLAEGVGRGVPEESLRPSEDLTEEPIPVVSPAELERRRTSSLRPVEQFPVGTVIEPGVEVIEPPDHGQYSFLMLVGGEPYRYPIAEPVPFVVREQGAPDKGLDLVQRALQEISDTSGFSFRYDGVTRRLPTEDERERIGLWIGWVFPEEEERFLTENILGFGGPRNLSVAEGNGHITGGMATVKAELDLVVDFGPQTMGSVLLHELGHALNLGHVDSAFEQMYPSMVATEPPMLGAGDRRGLWLLGAGRGKPS